MSSSGILADLGYAGLALLMVAETVFPPIPSEVVLPLAGYLVQTGDFAFLPALRARAAASSSPGDADDHSYPERPGHDDAVRP